MAVDINIETHEKLWVGLNINNHYIWLYFNDFYIGIKIPLKVNLVNFFMVRGPKGTCSVLLYVWILFYSCRSYGLNCNYMPTFIVV